MTAALAYTPLEEAAVLYSDMHKDAYGFRPRHAQYDTPEEYYQAMDELQPIIEEQIRENAIAEQQRLVEFCQTIRALCRTHDIEPYTALRWLFDAADREMDHPMDVDAFFWKTGIPYQTQMELGRWVLEQAKEGDR
jgi:hypothetical protein